MDYEELKDWILNKMDLNQWKNYQPVMIRTLLQNKDKVAKKKIQLELHNANPEHPSEYFSDSPVFDTLTRNKVTSFNKSKKEYELILDEPLSAAQRDTLVSECNRIIESISSESKTERQQKKYILSELEEFYGKVNTMQLQVLRRYKRKAGRTLSAAKLRGSSIGGVKLTSKSVDGQFLMHTLYSSTYQPEKSGYAQAIMLRADSKWGLEIERDHPTLKINYNFTGGETKQHETDKKFLRACYEIGLPIGLLFRLADNKFRCLGLGKIVKINENTFVIESFGISPEESTKLKDDVLADYDIITKDPSVKKIPDVNYEKICRSDLDGDFPDKELTQQIQTDRQPYKIAHLIDKCERGELVIPAFQRFFIWKKEMVRKFFDSVFNGYYIGPFLLWENPDKDIGTQAIEGVKIKDPPADLVIIDGQQRISSIYYALRSPENVKLKGEKESTFFYIDFGKYFEKNEKSDVITTFSKEVDVDEQYKKLLFPLNQLENHEQWLRQWSKFMNVNNPKLDYHNDVIKLEDKIRTKLRFILKEFPCTNTILQNTNLDQVIQIFERINTTGEKLNAFDLLIAKLSKYQINLRDLWVKAWKDNEKLDEYLEKPTYGSHGLPILHSMSLCFTDSGSCQRKDILKIFERMNTNKEDFEKKWWEMVKYTETTINLLQERTGDGFGVLKINYLPSESMIPVLAALQRTMDEKYSAKKACREKIQFWYWVSVFTNAYSGSSDTRKTFDYKQITEWFSNDSKIPISVSDLREDFFRDLKLEYAVKKGESRFNAVLSLCALRGCRDWITYSEAMPQEKYPKKEYELQVDHIFPKHHFKNEPNNESILNKTFLHTKTNNSSKKAKKPSEILPIVLKKNYDDDRFALLETLHGHFINSEAYEYLLNDNQEGFLQEREHEILKEIGERIGSKNIDWLPPLKSTALPPEETIEELIEKGETDELEYKATLKYDRKQKRANPEMVKEVITTIAGFMNNKNGGMLVVGYDEKEKEVNGIDEDFPFVGKSHDFDDWQNALISSFEEHCGKEFADCIEDIRPEKIKNELFGIVITGTTLTRIVVKFSSSGPVYYDKEFYRRTHGRTTKLEGREMTNYIKKTWQ